MSGRLFGKKLSSFQIIIAGFFSVILLGAMVLMLPVSSQQGMWTSMEDALFTSTSAVCVTGLVVRDTASYWSIFGQVVILLLIQIGGLGIVSVAAFIATTSGRKISLLQRSMLQECISAHQIGGVVKMTGFIVKVTLLVELAGALVMMPTFCREFGAEGIWMSVFHSISAFCNAGFDVMGVRTGAYSSLTHFSGSAGVSLPISLLIMIGGIGFLTWDDIAANKFRVKRYRMQTKAILLATAALILLPTLFFFFGEFSEYPLGERICLSVFQAVTPRTAGFNTANMSALSGAGRAMLILLMVIGGAPGSAAGGIKVTTAMVLFATTHAAFRRRKSPQMFGRRIEDDIVKNAVTLLIMYLTLMFAGAFIISAVERLPFGTCVFETSSAIGTVGLSLGITPSLGTVSHMILIALMFLGRVGGLTLMYAAVSNRGVEVAQYPAEKIMVG